MAITEYDAPWWTPNGVTPELLIGQSVTVYQDNAGVLGASLQTLYTDENGGSTAPNPIPGGVDAGGNVKFFADAAYAWVKVGAFAAVRIQLRPPGLLDKTTSTEQSVTSKLNWDAGIRFRKNPHRDVSHPDFGCGQGGVNDGPGLQACIDDGPGKIYLPPEGDTSSGIYTITTPVSTSAVQTERHIYGGKAGWNKGKASTIACATSIIALRLDGGNSLIEDVLLDGRDPAGNNAGGIGCVFGPNHKTNGNRVTARYFKDGGLVWDGTQNASFNDMDAQFNGVDYWITNNARTLRFNMASGTDDVGSINAYMDAIDPNAVALWIGRRAQPYITMLTDPVDIPGDLTFDGILERFERHNYNVRISHGWGYIRLRDLNLQGAKLALIKIDAGAAPYAVPLRLILDNITPQNTDGGAGVVKTIDMAANEPNVEIFAPIGPGFTGANRWFEARVKESVHTEDYGNYQHHLAAPPTFGHSIGAWITQGGGAVVSLVNRRLRVNIAGGFGAVCIPGPRWLSSGVGGPFVYTANHIMRVKYHVTAMAPTDIKIAAELTGSPFRRTIGTITVAGVGEFTYACQGDETGQISVHGFGGAGSGNVDFAELATTVY